MDFVDHDSAIRMPTQARSNAPMDAVTTTAIPDKHLPARSTTLLHSSTDVQEDHYLPVKGTIFSPIIPSSSTPSLPTRAQPSIETLADIVDGATMLDHVTGGTTPSLNVQLHHLQTQIAQLQAQNDALLTENTALKTELSDTKTENASLKQQLSQLSASHTATQKKLSTSSVENITLKSQCLSLSNETTKLKSLLSIANTQLSKLDDSNASLLDQVKILEMFFYNPHVVMGVVELVDTDRGEDVRVLLINNVDIQTPNGVSMSVKKNTLCRDVYGTEWVEFWCGKYRESMNNGKGERLPIC